MKQYRETALSICGWIIICSSIGFWIWKWGYSEGERSIEIDIPFLEIYHGEREPGISYVLLHQYHAEGKYKSRVKVKEDALPAGVHATKVQMAGWTSPCSKGVHERLSLWRFENETSDPVLLDYSIYENFPDANSVFDSDENGTLEILSQSTSSRANN